MRYFTTLSIALAGVFCALPLAAQDRAAIELRGGAALPMEDLGGSDLDPGGGFGLTAALRFMPHVLAYAGWDWFRLTTDEPFAGMDLDVENTGYAFGLKFQHPLLSDVEGWLRAGAIYNHVELENGDGDRVADSGHELGWEAGTGASIPIGRRFALTPGVRYRTFSGEVDAGTGPIDVNVSYVALEVGIAYQFGARVFSALRR